MILFIASALLSGYDLVPLASVVMKTEQATGVVKRVVQGGWVSHGEHSAVKNSIWYYSYTFTDHTGAAHKGTFRGLGGEYSGYSDGSETNTYKVGDKVPIDYIAARPAISHIAGLASPTSPVVATVVLLFTAVGIFLLIKALQLGVVFWRLYRYGEITHGELTKTKLLKPSENRDNFVCRATYSFTISDGKTYKCDTDIDAGYADEGQDAPASMPEAPAEAEIIYDPRRPADGELTSELFGYPRFDRPGMAYCGRPTRIIGWTIAPALVVGVQLLLILANYPGKQ